MLADQHTTHTVTREVHPFLHLFGILVCLIAVLSIDLSSLPEIVAVVAYEIMILAAAVLALHWLYIARHRTIEVED